jgi:hypothetical protein
MEARNLGDSSVCVNYSAPKSFMRHGRASKETPFTSRTKRDSIGASPHQENMEQKPASTEDHSFGRELRVGLAGLGTAAGLIAVFLLIMSYLAHIVAEHFGGSLPFFLDKG